MRLFSDDLLRHTSILFSGMMVVHVCNMVFQMAVIRALSKEEYALLAAFLGALAIMQRPLGALATGMNRYSSLLRQEGRAGDIKRLLRKWLLLTGGGGLYAGLLMVVFNRQLAGAFHLDRTAPVVIAGAVLPALFCSPVLGGVVRGMQCFKWFRRHRFWGHWPVWGWVPGLSGLPTQPAVGRCWGTGWDCI